MNLLDPLAARRSREERSFLERALFPPLPGISRAGRRRFRRHSYRARPAILAVVEVQEFPSATTPTLMPADEMPEGHLVDFPFIQEFFQRQRQGTNRR